MAKENEGGYVDAYSDRELIYRSEVTLVHRSICPCTGNDDTNDEHKTDTNLQLVAIKTLRAICPDHEQLRAFYREYDVLSSERLSSCQSVRKALNTGVNEDGLHEIHLEWVDGITLRQWIQREYEKFKPLQTESHADMKNFRVLANVAYMLVKSVSEIHCAGAVINNISAENFILSHATGTEESCVEMNTLKIIDLSSAHFLEMRGESTCIEANEHFESNKALPNYQCDLKRLGAVLYELFSGREHIGNNDFTPSTKVCSESSVVLKELSIQNETNEPMQKKKETKCLAGCDYYESLRELGVPVSLCALVSNMVYTKEAGSSPQNGQEYYQSMSEVEEDLRFMILDPSRFLWDIYKESLEDIGSLDIVKGKLYGRDKHVSTLMDVYDRFKNGASCGSSKEMVLFSGYAGVGKSTLVQNVREPLINAGGSFINGKFDQFQQAKPLSVIADAFNEYCNTILDSNHEDRDAILSSIQDAVGSGGKVLVDLMPNLSKIVGQDLETCAHVSGVESLNQLNFLFHEFIRAIATPSYPVIFFLDDLQWADSTSLELIRLIVADARIFSFLLIGCYRDNETENNHPLMGTMQKLEQAGVSITEIKVNTIDVESINAWTSDILHLTPRLTRPLSKVVYRKTGGNPLFIIQFLKSLNDEGVLRFSLSSWRWEWDIEGINFMNIHDNFVDLMKNKMLKLSKDVQWTLKVAACLGRQCDESALRLLNDVNGTQVLDIVHNLTVAVCEGLVDKAETRYMFSHDQIQRAAYSLVPESEREALHLQIGRLILARSSALEMERFLFLVVDQLNRGSTLIKDYDERIKLAHLNLKAGEKAMHCSDFIVAAAYLKAGVSLLDDEKDWVRNYSLSIKLYNSFAEADYVVGNFSRMKLSLGKLFINAKSFEDKLGAYFTLVTSLAGQNKALDAVRTTLEILSQLEETFPVSVDHLICLEELRKIQKMLAKMPETSLMNLDVMRDAQKLAAMRFLDRLILYSFMAKPEFLPIVVSRAVQLSLTYGVSKESAHAFVVYGIILCSSMSDARAGSRFGKLALSLLERFKARECFARVYSGVYGVINAWIEPVHLSLGPLLESHKVGMLTGDTEFAMLCIHQYLCYGLLFCGKSLVPLAEEMRVYCLHMANFNQDSIVSLTKPYWQTTMNLIGDSENPFKLTGEVMDEEEEVRTLLRNNNSSAVCVIHLCTLWLAYLFLNYELAAEMAEASRSNETLQSGGIEICKHTFFDGLNALALARITKLKKWRNLADTLIERMKKWASGSEWNFQHMLQLMIAERSFSAGDYHNARKHYDEAISSAGQHGFIHDQALACERAGIFHIETGDENVAKEYFLQAQKYYRDWGAHAKADQVYFQ